jgi:hypothetical protein
LLFPDLPWPELRGQSGQILSEGPREAELLGSLIIPDHIQSDPVQPGLNAALSAKTLPRTVCLHKGILHDRLGQILVSERKGNKAKQAGAMCLYQLVNVIQLGDGTRLDREANEVRGMSCIHVLIDEDSSELITERAPALMDRVLRANSHEWLRLRLRANRMRTL